MGGVIQGFLAAHTPRIFNEEFARAPVFQPLIAGMKQLAGEVGRGRPDAVVLNSTHWFTTFKHYVLGQARHRGVLTAQECPDLIRNVHYDYPGDPALARAIVERAGAKGVPVVFTDEETFIWDYGTYVPLSYMVPKADVPVVVISTCGVSELEESYALGQAVHEAAEATGRRVAFAASGSLSHTLVRGPERWPTDEARAMDEKVMDLLTAGRVAELKAFLPEFVKGTEAEGWGKHLAMLIGATGDGFRGKVHGYGPSSGTGNGVISLSRMAA